MKGNCRGILDSASDNPMLCIAPMHGRLIRVKTLIQGWRHRRTRLTRVKREHGICLALRERSYFTNAKAVLVPVACHQENVSTQSGPARGPAG